MICPVCDGERFEEALIAYDRTVAREGEFRYRRCLSCRLLSQTPLPSADELAGLYPADYGPHEKEDSRGKAGARRRGGRPWNRLALRSLHAEHGAPRTTFGVHARGLLGRVAAADIALPRGSNRLLDVGCGSGGLLARHRALGWNVRGIEPNPRAASACREAGLPVECAGLLDAELPAAHFDVVTLNHVIEHVLDPKAALERAGSLLAPGGLLIVVTPNTAGLGLRMYGSCWYALDAPRHLHLFDPANLRRLGERAGLSAVSVAVHGSTRVLAQSRRYARTQGARLPEPLEARRAIVARAAGGERDAIFRRLASPFVASLAWLGIGDTLRARFTRAEP